jgi:N-acetylglucosaminyl-diphospho-decaprenol L-rhamnosyltransferase
LNQPSRPDPLAPPLSVVVVTYNSSRTLRACLEALAPSVAALGGELVVVDNGSADGTVGIASEFPVEVVETGRNLGFAAGCNEGARHCSGELITFVNPDALVTPDALEALASTAREDARCGPLGGRAELPDGAYDPRSVMGGPSLRGALLFALGIDRLFRGSRRLDPEHGPAHLPVSRGSHAVPAVSGAFIAIPRALWDALEGFDERFFLYGEDVDLCLRAARLGWRPTLVARSAYRHVGGVSSSDNNARDRLLYRGKVELYRRHLARPGADIAVVALQLGVLLRGLPAILRLPRVAATARPWWALFRDRQVWRRGYRDHVPGEILL